MRDRLIEILKRFCTDDCKITHQCGYCDFGDLTVCPSAVADHLLANGVIVPPCKVGDTVYMPWEWNGTSGVAILTINRIVVDFTHRPYVNTNFFSDDEEYWLAYNCGRFDFNDFGKTVFLTKKLAEKALAERSGE